MAFLISQRRPSGMEVAAVIVLIGFAAMVSPASALPSKRGTTTATTALSPWGTQGDHRICSGSSPTLSSQSDGVLESLRAGATVEVEEDSEEEDADSEEDEDEEEVYDEDERSSYEDESEYESAEEEEVSVSVQEYDAQIRPPAGLQLGAMLGVMLLSRRIDLFSPKVVRFARFLFIFYIIAQQAFLVYVRIMAKQRNDRAEIDVTNPLSGLLSSQLSQKQGGGGDMVKDLASQFLASKTTIMEYDLKQAKSMNNGLLINMAFMWFLHFKMQQTQPLIAQTVTGMLNLFYSPLFQVYMLGRNLERPFKNAAVASLDSKKEGSESVDEVIEEEIDLEVDIDEETAETSDEGDDVEEEEDGAESDEYDSDESEDDIDESDDESDDDDGSDDDEKEDD